MEAAFGDHLNLTMTRHIAQNFTGTLIQNTCAYRNFNGDVLTAFPRTVTALTVGTAFSAVRFHKAEIDQRIEVFISHQEDVTAVTTVTAIRAATRDILLTTEAHTAVTAITCHDQYGGFIYKLHLYRLRKSFTRRLKFSHQVLFCPTRPPTMAYCGKHRSRHHHECTKITNCVKYGCRKHARPGECQ